MIFCTKLKCKHILNNGFKLKKISIKKKIQRYSIYVNKLEENLLQEAALISQQQPPALPPLMVNPTFVLNDQLNTNHTYHQFTPNSTQAPSGPLYFNNNSINNNHHHVSPPAAPHTPMLSTSIQNEMSPSKSMPTTPNLNNLTSPLKSTMNQPYANGQNFHVNFNISPTNGGSKVHLNNSNSNNDSSIPMTNVSTVLSPKSIKFNNYVD